MMRGDVTPTYARLAAAPALEGDSRGYGAYLGTVPDFVRETFVEYTDHGGNDTQIVALKGVKAFFRGHNRPQSNRLARRCFI